jgi:hypothetical protein
MSVIAAVEDLSSSGPDSDIAIKVIENDRQDLVAEIHARAGGSVNVFLQGSVR